MVTTKGLSEVATKSHREGLDHSYCTLICFCNRVNTAYHLSKRTQRFQEFVKMCPVRERRNCPTHVHQCQLSSIGSDTYWRYNFIKHRPLLSLPRYYLCYVLSLQLGVRMRPYLYRSTRSLQSLCMYFSYK